jgi:hypothetical protein
LPGESQSIGGAVPDEPECVVIKNLTESFVHLESYEDGATYVVRVASDSPEPLAVTIFPQSELPPGESNIPNWVGYILLAVMASGGAVAAFIAGRFFIRYYITEPRA